MTEADARAQLVAAGRRLLAEGLVARSWGNLSVRLGENTMAVTPSGIPWEAFEPDMVSLVDLATGDWSGRWKPSGERKVHREVYRRRPDVTAVVHTHQNAASVCAAARVGAVVDGEAVACARYALPGTKRLTRRTVDALGAGPAVLLANHGVFAVGASLGQAFDRVAALEAACAALVALSADTLPAPVDAPWRPEWLVPAPEVAAGAFWSRAPYTLAWSRQGDPLRAALDDLAQLAGARVPCLPRPRPPGEGAVLVRGLGALVGGPDAAALALVVEKSARAALGGRALGGAKPLPAWEAALMRLVYRQSYAKQAANA